jgi:hypothetical protein
MDCDAFLQAGRDVNANASKDKLGEVRIEMERAQFTNLP